MSQFDSSLNGLYLIEQSTCIDAIVKYIGLSKAIIQQPFKLESPNLD